MMELKAILLRKLDSILNPRIENRMILAFLTLGSLLVGVPSVLAISAVLSVKHGDTTFTAEINNGNDLSMMALGVMFLVISLYLFERNQKHRESKEVSVEKKKDRAAVQTIMEAINTNVIDAAIERGSLSQFYDPVLHYYYGVEELARSSSFNLYDERLRVLFEQLHQSFSAFVSHGAHFRETPNPDLYRFVKPHEVGDWKTHETYETSYLADVESFFSAYRSFMEYVKNEYPDLDLSATNRAASEDYVKHHSDVLG